jgi:hypothetical protein
MKLDFISQPFSKSTLSFAGLKEGCKLPVFLLIQVLIKMNGA